MGRTHPSPEARVGLGALVGGLRREAGGVLLTKLGGAALAFGAQLALARRLGVDGFGAYALSMAVLNSLLVFSRLGFDTSPLRLATLFLADRDWGRLRGFLNLCRRLPPAAGLVLGGGTALFLEMALPAGSVRTALMVGCVAVPIWTSLLVDQATLRSLGRAALAFTAGELVRPGVLLVSILLLGGTLLKTPADAPRAVAMHLVGITVGALLNVALVWWTMPADARRAEPVLEVGSWVRTSVALGAVTGVAALLNQVDTLVVGSLLDPADVGLFSLARRIATLLSFGLVAVNAVAAPRFSRLHRDGDRAALGDYVRRAARLAMAATLVPAVVIAMFGRTILGWFGPEFVAAHTLLDIFLVGQVVNASCGPVALLLALTGHARVTTHVFGVSLIVLLAGCLVVVPRFGILGAAVVSAAVLIGWNLTMVWISSRRLGVRGSIF